MSGNWPWEYFVPGKGWVNAASMKGEDHLAVARLYQRAAEGDYDGPIKRWIGAEDPEQLMER